MNEKYLCKKVHIRVGKPNEIGTVSYLLTSQDDIKMYFHKDIGILSFYLPDDSPLPIKQVFECLVPLSSIRFVFEVTENNSGAIRLVLFDGDLLTKIGKNRFVFQIGLFQIIL